ncbi:hypothetical protein POM88_013656 [Heracleum sosnowskyi]|uniref:Replication factor A C-terminal domain-containing protein n=1 Tax=Heracleum sosnowskyi TaxID=360622 RepID=A0AAD8J2L1_9APIA|nr:hypothetical protein POM88_013656 [Heracleum sosnowskyi]
MLCATAFVVHSMTKDNNNGNRSWHLFNSDDLIGGYKSVAKSARATKRRLVRKEEKVSVNNKENVAVNEKENGSCLNPYGYHNKIRFQSAAEDSDKECDMRPASGSDPKKGNSLSTTTLIQHSILQKKKTKAGMELYLYESIKDFHTSTYDWKCKVRLQNVWKGIKRDTLEFYGLNIIFIDDHNSRIHAFASSKYCEDILKDITEEKIYILSNFKVKDFVGDETYRLMEHMQSLMSIPEIISIKQKLLTVKEIKELPANFNEVEVNCEVSVKRVDENVSWYYNKCTGCKREIYRDNGFFRCTKCPRIIPYPDKRFRVCTICSDNTGSIQIIFPDSAGSRITDTTVVDIHSECLLCMKPKRLCKVWKLVTILIQIKKSQCKLRRTHQTKTFKKEDLTFQTPQTGNSTNVKTRARKNVEPVTYDDTENDMLEKLKNMKKKKIKLANVYSIKNFTVQPYKADDIFRCVRNENQLILSKDTKIQDMEENTSQIREDVFDLYDHSELKALSEQRVYLADEVDICNVGATKYYLNYKHHSMVQLRKIFDNGFFVCDDCKRIVPHPDKRYKIKALASDTTGGIEIVMEDREVRNLIGLRARNLFNQQKKEKKEDTFPICLKNIGMEDYTLILRIKQMNVVDKINDFWATNTCPNFIKPDRHVQR